MFYFEGHPSGRGLGTLAHGEEDGVVLRYRGGLQVLVADARVINILEGHGDF